MQIIFFSSLWLMIHKESFFGFLGHHFMIATLPAQPYVTEMIPVGFTEDGSITFRMTGFFPEVFDNLQVC